MVKYFYRPTKHMTINVKKSHFLCGSLSDWKLHRSATYAPHTSAAGKSVRRSNTSISRNQAVNMFLTIHFKDWSHRSHSSFSIQRPIYGLDFPFPSGSIDQTAYLECFKVDITTDSYRYLQLQCKNCSHYSTDWPLLHLLVVGILWFGRYLYLHRAESPSQY